MIRIRKEALTLFGLAFLCAGPAFATTPAWLDDDDDEEAEEEEDEEEGDAWFAVVGGDVYTGTGAFLRGATVLSKNGVIEEIGFEVDLPDEAETLDAAGLRVYPGLVAISASPSLTTSAATVDVGHPPHAHPWEHEDEIDQTEIVSDWFARGLGELGVEGDPTQEALLTLAIEDGIDPFGSQLILALSSGITTVNQNNNAIKLKRGEFKGTAMRTGHLIPLSYSLGSPSGIRDLRAKFTRAREYMREMREYAREKKEDEDLKEPSKKDVDGRMLAIMKGDVRARFTSNSREDLLGIARLAQEFGFRPVIEGCTEGWTVASELGRAGATAIIDPRFKANKSEELVRAGGSSIENAAILHRHGVQVALRSGSNSIELNGMTGRDILYLPIEAGFAIRGGLDERSAIDGITVVPARVLGVDDRVGTLEVGKDCDLIVTDGDLLHYETFVQYTVVEGKLVYDKAEELFFSNIRPRETAGDEDAGEGSAEE